MNRRWRILLGPEERADRQMALDEALARRAEPVARFFTWKPAGVSLGWKQPRPAWLDPARWSAAGLALVERPTGGGIAVHGTDLSVSVVIPREEWVPLSSLIGAVCQSAVQLCRRFGAEAHAVVDVAANQRVVYCLAEPSSYAVMIGTRKVAGFALRRFSRSWLIQGSVLIRPLSRLLVQALPAEAQAAFDSRAVALSEATARPVTERVIASAWAEHWIDWWQEEMITQILKDDYTDKANERIKQSTVLSA